MKKVLELLLKEPITTIQGFLYGLVGVLSFYSVITPEEGGTWIIAILAVFKIFSRDNSFKSASRIVEIGGGTGGTIKPRKT